ncbi:hypothetical protein [Dactylosporangium sp. CA-233914]
MDPTGDPMLVGYPCAAVRTARPSAVLGSTSSVPIEAASASRA